MEPWRRRDAESFAAPKSAPGARLAAAATELLRRERAPAPLPHNTYDLVGPDSLTGQAVASIWSQALGRTVRYGGDDLVAMEQRMRAMLPGWHALDLRLMFQRYQKDGAAAEPASRRCSVVRRGPTATSPATQPPNGPSAERPGRRYSDPALAVS